MLVYSEVKDPLLLGDNIVPDTVTSQVLKQISNNNSFKTPINTISNSVDLRIDGIELEVGIINEKKFKDLVNKPESDNRKEALLYFKTMTEYFTLSKTLVDNNLLSQLSNFEAFACDFWERSIPDEETIDKLSLEFIKNILDSQKKLELEQVLQEAKYGSAKMKKEL